MLALRDEGVAVEEIARRFKKGPDHVERVLQWTQIPRDRAPQRSGGLSPIERRVLALRAENESYDEIGRRFKRSADHIRRVERYAGFRLDLT